MHYLRSVGITESRVVLVTPPPLCEAAWERHCLAQGKEPGEEGLQELHSQSSCRAHEAVGLAHLWCLLLCALVALARYSPAAWAALGWPFSSDLWPPALTPPPSLPSATTVGCHKGRSCCGAGTGPSALDISPRGLQPPQATFLSHHQWLNSLPLTPDPTVPT